MDDSDWLAERFEENRPRLRAVAYRMLGSSAEADDAVQEAWLRLHRSDASGIENLGGWLTTVVGRVCLDMLRTRTSRREDPLDAEEAEVAGDASEVADAADPEHAVLRADAVGLALLVILETLTPAERLAFVLHDLFAVPFDEIAPIVDRSPAAARQLASRARRRVQGASPDDDEPTSGSAARKQQIVEAFLAASRGGDFEALLSLLDPEVVLRADATAVSFGATGEVRGARDVAVTFSGRAQNARLGLVDGAPGAIWSISGSPRVVFAFTLDGDHIVGIDLLADAEHLGRMELELLEG